MHHKVHQKEDETTIYYGEDLDLVMPMYNLIEYTSNHSDTTDKLWFQSEEESPNFNGNVTNTDAFKSVKYKAKLIKNTVA